MKPTPYFLVWRENGPAPVVKHDTLTSADTEARRLALTNPGHTYCVLPVYSRITAQNLNVEIFDTDLDIPF